MNRRTLISAAAAAPVASALPAVAAPVAHDPQLAMRIIMCRTGSPEQAAAELRWILREGADRVAERETAIDAATRQAPYTHDDEDRFARAERFLRVIDTGSPA